MSGDLEKEVKETKTTTSENTIAIAELTIIANQTSKDVDRIVKHIDKMIPLNSRVTSLEDDIKSIFDIIKGMWSGNIVKWIFTLMIGFNAYLMLEIYSLRVLVQELSTTIETKIIEKIEKDKAFQKSIDGLNQKHNTEHKDLRDELHQQQLYQGNNHTKIMGLTDRFNSKGG